MNDDSRPTHKIVRCRKCDGKRLIPMWVPFKRLVATWRCPNRVMVG